MCVKSCQCNTCDRFNTCADCEHNKDIKDVECMPPFGKGVQNCPHYKPFKHITIPKSVYTPVPEDLIAKIKYKPPIEIIRHEMEMRLENDTMKVVQQNDIFVDKDELIKALQYDRDQYIKGFEDGKRDNFEELIKQVRADTLRELQKLIAEHATKGYPRKVRLSDINKVIKEMLEREENNAKI